MTGYVTLLGAWVAILLGCLAGAAEGLFFHEEGWLGGYGSWKRRMLRLGHISLIALGILNVVFIGTAALSDFARDIEALPSALFFVAMCAMPAVCFLSAVRPAFRRLFFIPAGCVIGGAGAVVWGLSWKLVSSQ